MASPVLPSLQNTVSLTMAYLSFVKHGGDDCDIWQMTAACKLWMIADEDISLTQALLFPRATFAPVFCLHTVRY